MSEDCIEIVEKLPVTTKVWDLEAKIVNIIKALNIVVEKYGEDVYLEYDDDQWGGGKYTAYRIRLETEEERDKRLAKISEAEEKKKETRRKQYEELRREFENESN